tara:strand:- start:103 stop:330 length:228 start_codon:yes stop_codon:yes gene_type:complete
VIVPNNLHKPQLMRDCESEVCTWDRAATPQWLRQDDTSVLFSQKLKKWQQFNALLVRLELFGSNKLSFRSVRHYY